MEYGMLSIKKNIFYVAVYCLLSSGFLYGKTNELFESGQITVTARGYKAPVSKTPGSVAVIEGLNMNMRNGVSVSDFVDGIPGVNTVSDGAWGSEFAIRGLSRESVVMLIDGCRVNTATAIGARFGMIVPFDVERVEILKGPVSALYGSGSLGGVVNVISRTGQFSADAESERKISAMAESNPDGYQSYVSWAENMPRHYIFLSQSYRDNESYEDGSGKEVDNSQFHDAQTSIRGGYKLSSRHMIEANLQYFRGSDIGVPGSGTAPLPAASDVTYSVSDRILASVVNTLKVDGSPLKESQLNFYYQFIERSVLIDSFPETSPMQKIEPEADHDTYGVRWLSIVSTDPHTISGGLDIWRRTYEGSRTKQLLSGSIIEEKPLPDATYDSSGLFLEDSIRVLNNLTLNFGARADAIGVENDATTGIDSGSESELSWDAHAGAVAGLSRDIALKAIISRGYRVASIEERFQYLELGGGVVKYGNPELESESSTFAEVGLEWIGERAFFSINAFGNYLDNLIAERVIDDTTVRNENFSEANIHGLEAGGAVYIRSDLKLSGNIAFTEGRDTVEDEYLAGIAPLNGNVSLRKGAAEGPWLEIHSQFAAEQDKAPEAVEPSVAWAVLGLDGGWRWIGEGVTHSLFIGASNLFDHSYRDYLATYRGNTYNEPGRSFSIGYEVIF